MRRIIALVLLVSLIYLPSMGQKIDKIIKKEEAERHLKYLSSDEMMGRDTGSPELKKAGEYIVDNFKDFGVETVPDHDGFYQKVPLIQTKVPSKAELQLLDSTLVHGINALVLQGMDTSATVPAVFAGYGMEDDLKDLDFKGKIVVAKFGFKDMTNVRQGFGTSKEKRSFVHKNGGLGVIELYSSRQINWSLLLLYLNRPSMILNKEGTDDLSVPFRILINDPDNKYLTRLEEEGIDEVTIDAKGLTPNFIDDRNIVGYIEGKDKTLKDEFVILSAHYDHVGHTAAGVDENGEPIDSIFNGARDNALGTTGLILAAKYFGKERPKRSILFIGFTAEEKGLLGSEYYAENPWVPLDQCIFNVNIDCAGYNDTTLLTIFGLTRNSAEEIFRNASSSYGLQVIDDPIPDQNIFERSDHFNFAKHGVPAVLYGPGVTAFDEEIQKYYHQVTDHAESLNFNYLIKVYKAYIKASEDIANMENKPFWAEGDKFESAGKELYKME